MNASKAFCLLILAVLLFSACAPKNVLRLETDHEDKMVYQGMEYLYSEAESSSVTLAYYRHINDNVVFDLEIVNYSDSIVQVSASDFSYKAYKLEFQNNRETGDYGWERKFIAEDTAYDPETTILDIDKTASKVEANERTNRVLDGIDVGMNLVSDISAAGRESYREQARRERRRTERAISRAERRDQFYRNVSSLSEQRQYWETQTLRRTDLFPDESIAGEVNFPIASKADIITITIDVGGDVHEFEYRQRTFAP
jgi:hypothetical protein